MSLTIFKNIKQSIDITGIKSVKISYPRLLIAFILFILFILSYHIVGSDHHDDHRWKAVFNPVSDRRSHQRAASYLTHDEHQKALSLLNDGLAFDEDKAGDGECQVVVSPRFGTISPWASKATDIFTNCGINIERVERVVLFTLIGDGELPRKLPQVAQNILHDRMTQSLSHDLSALKALFADDKPKHLTHIDIMGQGRSALVQANGEFGFALSDEDMDYLVKHFNILARNPTDVELMMFAQANSEHCRHKIFNAQWTIDGKKQDKSLFKMIKNTHESSPEGILSAYKDNAAVMEGFTAKRFYVNKNSDGVHEYGFHKEPVDILMKVETHNHPTAIAPYAGAATGSAYLICICQTCLKNGKKIPKYTVSLHAWHPPLKL